MLKVLELPKLLKKKKKIKFEVFWVELEAKKNLMRRQSCTKYLRQTLVFI